MFKKLLLLTLLLFVPVHAQYGRTTQTTTQLKTENNKLKQ